MTISLSQNHSHNIVDLQRRISDILGTEVTGFEPARGGSVGLVYRVSSNNGYQIIAKVDNSPGSELETEAFMLRFLARNSRLPVPEVIYGDASLLLLELLPGRSYFTVPAQQHAAELLAELHSLKAAMFGFERATAIAGMHQPNPWSVSWLDFFREHRLLYMARQAYQGGRLQEGLLNRIESFCERLPEWLEEPLHPALIHGDAWTGNILADSGRITAFLDPAIYYADPEIELAFTTLFGTFNEHFFERYQELRPIRPGFMELRRDIYNLYPLLVHVRLFGGSYIHSVDQILNRFGE